MHFGIYLHRKGVISADQLVAALEIQFKLLTPIGQLALEEGILSAHDIFSVLRAQRDVPLERFGEIAIELGLMTCDDLMRLLMLQSDRKPSLIEILVKQGALGEDAATAELIAYRTQLAEPTARVQTTMLPMRARRDRLAQSTGIATV